MYARELGAEKANFRVVRDGLSRALVEYPRYVKGIGLDPKNSRKLFVVSGLGINFPGQIIAARDEFGKLHFFVLEPFRNKGVKNGNR